MTSGYLFIHRNPMAEFLVVALSLIRGARVRVRIGRRIVVVLAGHSVYSLLGMLSAW